MRAGHVREWDPDDLQSFTPLRFYPPQAMGFEGRAVITDPDIFAVGDVGELFERDLQDKPIWAVPRPGHNNQPDYIATSVMLLDCAKLTHWQFDKDLDDLFGHRFDYIDWIEVKREDRSTIGALEPEWNDFDRLTPRDQAASHDQAQDPAMEDRAAGRLYPAREWSVRFPAPADDAGATPRTQTATRKLMSFRCSPRWSMAARSRRRSWSTEMAANHIRHDSLDLIERYRGWRLCEQAA